MDDLSQPGLAPSAPQPAAKAKVPVFKIGYNGKHGAVFRLHLLNLFLNIITLGIYSFWGKTRIRRYITSHISLANDQFEYTGTGKELLFGALKALVIFVPIVICLSIPVVNLIALPIFWGVISLAIYLALRYRLSRTRWRGIRFSLGGSIKEYLILSIKRTLINIITLGWKIPKSDIKKWDYIANHMHYGDIKFSYKGDASRLQKIHVLTIVIFMIMFITPVIAGGVMKGKDLIRHAEEQHQAKMAASHPADLALPAPNDSTDTSIAPDKNTSGSEEGLALIVSFSYLGFAIGGGARLWYHAALWQEKFRGLRLGDIRFKCDVTGKGLLKLWAINILIIIFSLGLAKPIATNRVVRYYTRNIRIGGDVNALCALQSKAAKTSGIGDALAADVGFDLGL